MKQFVWIYSLEKRQPPRPAWFPSSPFLTRLTGRGQRKGSRLQWRSWMRRRLFSSRRESEQILAWRTRVLLFFSCLWSVTECIVIWLSCRSQVSLQKCCTQARVSQDKKMSEHKEKKHERQRRREVCVCLGFQLSSCPPPEGSRAPPLTHWLKERGHKYIAIKWIILMWVNGFSDSSTTMVVMRHQQLPLAVMEHAGGAISADIHRETHYKSIIWLSAPFSYICIVRKGCPLCLHGISPT